ncbi:jg4825 [Pararge aegeria aegeria]|uniref:Jg4825 protein n=1 Tax=Pararge aegeria aegeria TaxID=348720 RepID=A0A8S4QJ35_9NEOP|nr:jg4825 [Pararge aegeria aegeria]
MSVCHSVPWPRIIVELQLEFIVDCSTRGEEMSYVTGAGINPKPTTDFRVTPSSDGVVTRILSVARVLGAPKSKAALTMS